MPLYTTKGVLQSVGEYGKVSIIFSWFVIFNVILSYGMETAFFRFFNKEENPDKVVGTSTIALIISSLGFFVLAYVFKSQISMLTDIKEEYISFSDIANIMTYSPHRLSPARLHDESVQRGGGRVQQRRRASFRVPAVLWPRP